MPRKIRELKAALRRAGFAARRGKGDHTFWSHPAAPEVAFSLDGKDGQDAHPYQEREVGRLIQAVEQALAARARLAAEQEKGKRP